MSPGRHDRLAFATGGRILQLTQKNGNGGAFDERLRYFCFVVLDVGDFARINLILGNAAGLVRVRGDKRPRTILQLARAASRDQDFAVVRIEISLNRHRSLLQKEILAGRGLFRFQMRPAQV